MVITHINDKDVRGMAPKDVGPIIKSSTTVNLVFEAAPRDAQQTADPPKQAERTDQKLLANTVTMDLSNGKKLGFQLMPNPATGTGIAVKSVDAGGQAELTGKIKQGMVITHINDKDVRGMAPKDVGPIIKSSTTVNLVLEAAPREAQQAADPPKQAE